MKKTFKRRFPIGAEYSPGGTHFRVWAPRCKTVEVVFIESGESLKLVSEKEGYFSGMFEVQPKCLYQFKLDGKKRLYPDPASRYQPEGPFGPSQIIDPSKFKWSDKKWNGVTKEGQVLYEMHIGTFTPEGTWKSASKKLAHLADLGITVIEMMPVADFPGNFNWGYDGVLFFAPTHNYGTPDDLRYFINEAHKLGIGVILDVVYNHFGPDGNPLLEFSQDYLTDKHKTEWGASLNFDGKKSKQSRLFFITNACYWIEEFHFDGLRFDACHAIKDVSKQHILAEITELARERAGQRSLYMIAENESQNIELILPQSQGGYALDAVWNEDLHHSAMVRLIGRKEAYYKDYNGSPQEFVSSAKYGFLYQGQWYDWQKQNRGTPTLNIASSCFVNFLMNHDQIANSETSLPPYMHTSPALWRAMTTFFLLMPQTPLLFQGQEFCASNPFHYFCDHNRELTKRIKKGRLKFLQQFERLQNPEVMKTISNLSYENAYHNSKLNWRELGENSKIFQMHKDLLVLRKKDPVFSNREKMGVDGAVLSESIFLIRFFGEEQRLLFVNFGIDCVLDPSAEPLVAPPSQCVWEILWSSEEIKYGGAGTCPWPAADGKCHLSAFSAVLLSPRKKEKN